MARNAGVGQSPSESNDDSEDEEQPKQHKGPLVFAGSDVSSTITIIISSRQHNAEVMDACA